MAWEKIILAQHLEGEVGNAVRILSDNAVILLPGEEHKFQEFPSRRYVWLSPKIRPNSFFNWVGLVNLEMIREGMKYRPNKIIAIDWFGATAAISLSRSLEIPLVSVFTSTERMRGFGLPESPLIEEAEKELAKCSRAFALNPEAARQLGIEAVTLEELGDRIEDIDADMGIPAD